MKSCATLPDINAVGDLLSLIAPCSALAYKALALKTLHEFTLRNLALIIRRSNQSETGIAPCCTEADRAPTNDALT